MNKKSFAAGIAAACVFFAVGCTSGQITVTKDDFKNTSIVKMELGQYAEGLREYEKAVYTREFSSAKKGPVITLFSFSTKVNAENLEPKAIIKIGDKTYNVSFSEITGEIQTTIHQQTTTSTTSGNSNQAGFVDYTKTSNNGNTASTTTKVSSSSNKIFRAKMMMDDDLENAILLADKVAMRIYFGTEASTYIIQEGDLKKIKNFIQSTPEHVIAN